MRVKNDTPFRFAARPASIEPPQVVASCVLRGAFKLAPGVLRPLLDDLGLAQGNLRGETFAEDDEERAGQALYPGDFADWKLESEVMFTGSAHAPGGKPVTELPVRLGLGALSKTLLVTGPRVFVKSLLGDSATRPAAFTKQRVDWTTAFGGPGFADNPAGAGRAGEAAPSVFYPGEMANGRNDKVRPAGFGPISSNWAARTALRGKKYDASWQKTRAPWFSVDFDGRYFQAAPPDQRLGAFLRGDEKLSLHNLHPAHPVLEAALPGLRPRAFLRDRAKTLHEARFLLDTVLVDGDADTVFLTWRAHVRSSDIELRDFTFALVVSEPLAEAPKPVAHYDAMLAAFEADPIGADAVRAAIKKKVEEVAAELPDGATPKEDGVIRLPTGTKGKAGELGGAFVDKIAGALATADAALGPRAETVGAQPSIKQRAAEALAKPPEKGPEARKKAADQIAGLSAQLSAARASAAKSGAPPEALAKIDRVLASPELAKAQAEAKRLRPPEARELVPGADLSERNLAELDLSGKDLGGADLTGADLTDTVLVGARLVGAKLDRARFVRSDLAGADLTGASLTQTMFLEVRGAGSVWARARMDRGVIADADLMGADLRGLQAKLSVLSRCKLGGACLDEARLELCMLDTTDLAAASLAHARLFRTALREVDADKAVLREATLDESSFNESTLREADLRGARARRASFFRADLERADLRRAVLVDCHFGEARLLGARCFAADLRKSRFRLANLDGADFLHANLLGCDLGRASVHKTVFRNANLYASQWQGTAGKDADLRDANLTLSTLVRW